MQKRVSSLAAAIVVLGIIGPVAGHAGSTNASAKVTVQISTINVLGPITNSTSGTTISTDWQPVLTQDIKTANNHDVLITAAFEVGLYTSTTVQSKLMVSDTSTATASIKVRAMVDGQPASPGEVVYGKRTQQLTATLEGAIAGCLTIITNSDGSLGIGLNTNCVAPEIIGLIQDTMSANSFVFGSFNLSSGFHNIQIQAKIDALGDNQNGTFTAAGMLGKGTLVVESVRLAKDPPLGYVIPTE
jgi:hypothetical protein